MSNPDAPIYVSRLTLRSASNLPSKLNAFISVRLANQEFKTRALSGSESVAWNEVFFPLMSKPYLSQVLEIQLFSHKAFKNSLIATGIVQLDKLSDRRLRRLRVSLAAVKDKHAPPNGRPIVVQVSLEGHTPSFSTLSRRIHHLVDSSKSAAAATGCTSFGGAMGGGGIGGAGFIPNGPMSQLSFAPYLVSALSVKPVSMDPSYLLHSAPSLSCLSPGSKDGLMAAPYNNPIFLAHNSRVNTSINGSASRGSSGSGNEGPTSVSGDGQTALDPVRHSFNPSATHSAFATPFGAPISASSTSPLNSSSLACSSAVNPFSASPSSSSTSSPFHSFTSNSSPLSPFAFANPEPLPTIHSLPLAPSIPAAAAKVPGRANASPLDAPLCSAPSISLGALKIYENKKASEIFFPLAGFEGAIYVGLRLNMKLSMIEVSLFSTRRDQRVTCPGSKIPSLANPFALSMKLLAELEDPKNANEADKYISDSNSNGGNKKWGEEERDVKGSSALNISHSSENSEDKGPILAFYPHALLDTDATAATTQASETEHKSFGDKGFEVTPGLIVFSQIRLNNILMGTDFSLIRLRASKSEMLYECPVSTVVAAHGWKGSLSFSTAARVLEDAWVDEKNETIFMNIVPNELSLMVTYDRKEPGIQLAVHDTIVNDTRAFELIVIDEECKRIGVHYKPADVQLGGELRLSQVYRLSDLHGTPLSMVRIRTFSISDSVIMSLEDAIEALGPHAQPISNFLGRNW